MNKKTEKKLRAINNSVPKELRDAVMQKQYVAPDLREEVLAVLAETPATEQEKKDHRRLKNLFDAGYYDAEEYVVDHEAAKKVEAWVDKEIKKAIKAGEIPPPKDDKDLQEYVKKTQRNERRKQKSDLRTQQGSKA